MIAIVHDNCEVAIPNAVARQLGITAGTQLDWQAADQPGLITVKVLPDRATAVASLQGAGHKHLRPGHHPVDALIAERQREG